MYSPNHYRITVEEDSDYLRYLDVLHLDWEEQSPTYYSPMTQFKQRIEEDRKND